MIAASSEIAPDAVAAHYDDLDYFYRDIWGEHVHHGFWLRGDESREEAVCQLVELVASEARIGRGARVCDIGCGYGATARMLAVEFAAEVTAITVSSAQHDFACQSTGNATNPRYLLGDWLKNDLPTESFDAAIAIESSEHMPDLPTFFSQAHRVLRPGARLVICAWLSADAPGPRARRWLLEPICREGRMPQMGTFADYERLGSAAGFALERQEDVTAKVARTWPTIARVFARKLISRPAYARFLFDRHANNRIFALTIFRIWLAYRTGAMRYGLLTFTKKQHAITADAPAPIDR